MRKSEAIARLESIRPVPNGQYSLQELVSTMIEVMLHLVKDDWQPEESDHEYAG